MNKIILLVLISSLSGCAQLGISEQKTANEKSISASQNKIGVMTYPSQIRGTYVFQTAEGKQIVCPEPFSDVASSSQLNIDAKLVNDLTHAVTVAIADTADTSSNQTLNQSLQLGLNAINEIVALEGRTQYVLLARDLLASTCIAAANGHLDSPNSAVAEQHKLIITALTNMLDTEQAKANAAQASAEASRVEATVQALKLDPKILNVPGTALEHIRERYRTCISDQSKNEVQLKECDSTLDRDLKILGTNL
ncbi:hypothetical protein [Thaumasiovibrio subtropicus]|uniref:hypothetical protein n=1 Tax=Thaumasiovibrio subtropicus TaxID=1891207 RepID=UPI000B35CA06|nr:hypothetical protein [Thaumasiovibrio subtropicus]